MRWQQGHRWAMAMLLFIAPLAALAQGKLDGSRHDLTVTGTGSVKSSSDNQICLFCHATHVAGNGQRTSWNQQLSSVAAYNLYASSTYKQANNQPSSRSKLCLSCHDGTVGIGQTYSSGKLPVQGALQRKNNLGTDLSTNHPFGFTLPAVDDGEIRLSLATAPPATADPAVKLFENKIECLTCHEPHTPNLDSSVQFMVRSNDHGALCNACHDPSRGTLAGWAASSHATAANTVSVGAQLPYSTVSANACESCHTGHNSSGTATRLLRDNQQNTCGRCHGAGPTVSPALPSVTVELSSAYSHPVGVSISAAHDPSERLPVSNSRHSECADCHNPHATQATTTASAPSNQQSLTGVSGISSSGSVLSTASNQYEICFKCHADSNNKPQSVSYAAYGREPVRAAWSSDPFNVRLDLSSPIARHNVTQPARAGISPSLRPVMLDVNGGATGRSLLSSAYIYCSDCHNNENARVSGGTAANGPHGSKWTHLLERQYQQNIPPVQGPGGKLTGITYIPGMNSPYALCDKCHDLDNKLNLSGSGTDAAFGKHKSHVVSDGASCSVCHAAHGVQGGVLTNNKHLVNFDTQIVAPYGTNTQPLMDASRRQCSLVCHGVTHNAASY